METGTYRVHIVSGDLKDCQSVIPSSPVTGNGSMLIMGLILKEYHGID